MLSTTAMTLAPGWRWTLSRIAGVVFIQLASLLFSAPVDTSRRRQAHRRAVLVGDDDVAYSAALEIWSLALIV
jgi:hypothetical protein